MAVPVAAKFATVGDVEQNGCDALPVGADGVEVTVMPVVFPLDIELLQLYEF